MPGTEFRLLYDIQVLGVDALDNVSKKTAQVDLDTKYSTASFQKLESQINRLVISGESYRSSLDRISAASRKFGQESSNLARDILKNDEARRRSIAETVRAEEDAQRKRDQMDRDYRRMMRDQDQAIKENARRAKDSSFVEGEGGRQMMHGMRTLSVLGGIRDSRSIDAFFGGFGGAAGLAGVGAALAIGETVNLVRDAAKNAEGLKRVADEMGITTTEASRLQMAARLSGQSLTDMSQAAHRLGDALEDPAGTGKKAAEALNKLGVSMQGSLGTVFEQAIQKLNAIKDPTERATEGFALFGQQWRRLAEMSKDLPGIGPGMDKNLIDKLVKAEAVLGDFDNRWTILKAKLVAGVIIPVAVKVSTTVDKMAFYGNTIAGVAESLLKGTPASSTLSIGGKQYKLTPDGKLVPVTQSHSSSTSGGVSGTAALDLRRANAALQDHSKPDLAEQLSAKEKELANARAKLENDVKTASAKDSGAQARLNTEAANVEKLTREYNKLEAAKKAANRDPSIIPNLIANYRGQVGVNDADRDPVAVMRERLRKQIQEATKEGASTGQVNQLRSIGVSDYMNALKQRRDEQAQFFGKMDAVVQEQYVKQAADLTNGAFSGTNKAMQSVLFPNFNAQTITEARLKAEQAAKDRQFRQADLEVQRGAIERQFGQRATLRRTSGHDTANLDYQDRMEMASRLYALQTKQAQLEEDADRRALEMQRAKYEYITAQDEARIERENKIAEINEQQRQETRSFATGLFNASISGQPNATSNFFREFGRRQVDQIIGNIGENALGTINSKLTLQRDPTKPGILGADAEHPNWFGKALRGTFFGFDAGNDKGLDRVSSTFTPLITETGRNTAATEQNTQAILQAAQGFGGGTIKGGSIPSPNLSSTGADVTRAVSKIPSAFERLAGLFGAPGGTSGFAGPVHLKQPLPLRMDFEGTPGVMGNAHTDIGAKAPPPIDTSSEYAPDDIMRSLGQSLGSLPSAPPFGGGITDSNDANRQMDDVLASMRRGDIEKANTIYQKQVDPELSAATGIASKLGQLMGGAKYTESGYGLGGVLTGGMDLGNGQGVALSGTQRLGLGLGIGAQAAGGAYEAVQGFSKGGARGDVQGIAGTLAAAAPFAGPAAPFLEAGAAITGLISSLFPDPRQERIRAIQRNLEHSAYITPAARNYDYASGSDSGFSVGSGGTLRAGGPNANYTVNLNASAMDANGVLNHFKDNPELWSQAMLLGMTSGDSAAVQSLVSWNSSQGGSIPNVWTNSNR